MDTPVLTSRVWLPLERIQSYVGVETLIGALGLLVLTTTLYRVFLRTTSPERHRSIQNEIRGLLYRTVAHALCLGVWVLAYRPEATVDRLEMRWLTVAGLAALVTGSAVLVQGLKILLMEYLFFQHKKEGVPVLLINLFALVLNILIFGTLARVAFNFNVTTVVATSAAFSVIFGLALQDTLGNLFAGISLQFDKPFDLGDWIEVVINGDRKVGQVEELTWRATVIIAPGDERITIPNKVIAGAHIANFSISGKPFVRRLNFRLPYDADLERSRQALLKAVRGEPEVVAEPAPIVLTSDPNESGVQATLVYFMTDYGKQWGTQDRVLSRALIELQGVGVRPAPLRHTVTQGVESPAKA